MSRTRPTSWRSRILSSLLCLMALTVATGCSNAPAPGAAATAEPSAPASPDRTAAAPASVSIPSLGVDSPVMPLGLNQDGTVQVPPADKGMTAGWYTGNPAPGSRGAAVVIGHNDTRHGRAVFHDLKKIRQGAEITVRTAGGTAFRFTVTATETVSKKAFPTDKVYGATTAPTLRLITCDGAYDAQGHTVDNLIVYAALR